MQERNAVDRMTSQDGIPLRMQWLVPVFHFPFGFHSFRYMIFISITGIAGKCTTPSFEALTDYHDEMPYLAVLYLLAECSALLSNCRCGAFEVADFVNGGRYEHRYCCGEGEVE